MIRAALFGALTAIAVTVAVLACTTLPSADAGSCPAPTAGQAGCVLPILAKNVTSWGSGLDAVKATCGVSADVATSLWAAHSQAEVLEGFVPRAIGVDGGIQP